MIALTRRFLLHSSARYLSVGVLNSLIGYSVIYGTMYLGEVDPSWANALGYGVGLIVSYTMNRRWTFKSDSAVPSSAIRFLAVVGVSYVANLLTVLALINSAGFNPYLAQAAGLVPYTMIGYLGSRFIAFRKPQC